MSEDELRDDDATAAAAPAVGVRSPVEAELEHDLREALRLGQLDVVYQPIVRSSDGRVTGVEALLRWTDAVRGAVPPAELVDAAEHSGLIDELGAWVLERGCRDRTAWRREHPATPLDLAVNVSPQQLVDPGFHQRVLDVLARTGMDPAALVLEMTENVDIDDVPRARDVLAALQGLTIRIALDDFGTGYSSLSYLQRFPVDIVKIDQGFIADLGRTPGGRAIVASVTDLAHVLGFTVTAEGVETAAHRDEVRELGCDSSQGYFFSRPLSAAGLDGLLEASPASGFVLPLAVA